ncbi:EF-hand calcium-binding domain-containing protein 6 [Chelonia mydas]|uniref:EF-hand calcium-binding domain-containing protein 6 n=1 Tax=Chelonia mydas TaxID=8469 RepID=M7AWU5_CHEMY|nr:EF-hand calcium-binding domain-containing protein 6 [Chelonia mydas]
MFINLHIYLLFPPKLFKIIKSLLNKHYQAIEKEFEDLDEMNSRRLTQETMYLLLKRFDIRPEITRGEIHRLWETLITNQDNTLDFMEFVRHFGYSPSSSCFPNAKISPPRKGDNNFRLCSKKLSCDSDILVDRVRAKVEYLWDDLKKEFEELDPYHTGFVSKEEFKDILTELCVHLNEYECEMLGQKFESNGDGRVSYLEFLKPFAFSRQRWKNGNNMAAVMQASQGETDQSHTGTQTAELGGLTTRLRKKLRGDWKTLRRAFKKLDIYSNGYLSLPEFRSVLKLCNLLLNEDEVYHILSKFDPNLDGRIDYKSFLEETCKKGQPRTAKKSTANPQ